MWMHGPGFGVRMPVRGLSGRAVAKRLGAARRAVAKALAAGAPPVYETRPPAESARSRVGPAVRALPEEFPDMPAAVLAQRVGRDGSITRFRQNAAGTRRRARRVGPADRLVHRPGGTGPVRLVVPARGRRSGLPAAGTGAGTGDGRGASPPDR